MSSIVEGMSLFITKIMAASKYLGSIRWETLIPLPSRVKARSEADGGVAHMIYTMKRGAFLNVLCVYHDN